MEPPENTCEHGREVSGSVYGGESHRQLRDSRFLKKDSVVYYFFLRKLSFFKY
jgi:hypothetical protein